MRNRTSMAVVAGMALLLSGCYESADVTWYEPGNYKGPKDPLLAKQKKEAQQEELRQRFRMVQTDR